MDTPFLTWGCIVALFAIIIVYRAVCSGIHHHSTGSTRAGRHHFVELGSEAEEFYVPGDPLPSERDDFE